MKHKLVVVFFVFAAAFCLSGSALAFTDGFVDQPIPWAANASQSMAATDGYIYYGSNTKIISTAPNTFVFAVNNNCVVAAKSDSNVKVYDTSAGSSGFSCSSTVTGIDGWRFALSWWTTNSSIYNSTHMPQFTSYTDAIAAAEQVIQENAAVYSYDIPIGYVAVFQSSGVIYFDTQFPDLSTSINVPLYGYWGSTGQTIGELTGYPVSGTQFPLAGGLSMLWTRGHPRNLLGQTYYGHSEHQSFSNYMYVYNPVYRSNNQGYNGSIRVSGSISGFRLYSLTASIDSNDTIIGTIPDGDDYVNVDTDPDTEVPVYTDPDGDPVSIPQPGGDTLLPEPVSNSNFLQKIVQILDNLLSEIAGLFTFAFRAIASLVEAASSFFSVIGGLFVWLPADVVTVIVSGFVLVVTIGVLKSFL